MSLIGPRPELVRYTNQYEGEEKDILKVRPGITDFSSVEFINLDEIVGGENADLDILYKEDQTKKLKQVMQDAGYKFGGYNIKHDEYEKDGVTIEMHRDVLFRLTNACRSSGR